MYQKNKEYYKGQLGDYLRSTGRLVSNKKPFQCLSPGHTDRHPSMFFYSKGNFCKCFACGAVMDIFDVISEDYNAPTFKEQMKVAESLYGDERMVVND